MRYKRLLVIVVTVLFVPLFAFSSFAVTESQVYENGYLVKRKGSEYNMPTQKSMNLGLFEIKERTINHTDHVETVKTPKVTGKGQIYFLNLFFKIMVKNGATA